jgi:molybdenum cofactor cytidylyltransferase
MPDIRPSTLDAIIDVFVSSGSQGICIPINNGNRGNLVLFGRGFFDELSDINGDRGGKAVLNSHDGDVTEVLVDDPGIHMDHNNP